MRVCVLRICPAVFFPGARFREMRPALLVSLLMSSTRPYACIDGCEEHPPIVALAGTRNLRDVIDDLNVRGRAWPVGRDVGIVHSGIAERTERLWNDATLRDFCASGEPPLLVGWSLGGGVAVCLSALLAMEGIRAHSVATFGAPRSGDARFAEWYLRSGLWERTVRYATPRDPVADLPRGRYRHVGRVVEVPCAHTSWWKHHDLRAYLEGTS